MPEAATTLAKYQFKTPEAVPAIKARVLALQGKVPEKLIVQTAAEAQYATELLSAVAEIRREAERDRTDAKKPVLAEGRHIDAAFKEVTAPLTAAERVIKEGLLAYRREQDRIEAERVAAEKARLEAEARDRQAMAALSGDDIVEPEPEVLPAVLPPPPRTITAGAAQAGFRKTWKVEVEDVKALCAAVAAGEVPVQAVEPNTTYLRSALLGLPEKERPAYSVPGVKFFQDEGITVR